MSQKKIEINMSRGEIQPPFINQRDNGIEIIKIDLDKDVSHEDQKEIMNLDHKEWHKVLTETGLDVAQISKKVTANDCALWVKAILEHTKEGDICLELGSGTGEVSAHLAANGRLMTLTDFSDDLIDASINLFRILFTQKFIDKVSFEYFDVLTNPWPWADNQFDCVFSVGLLEHFDDNQIQHIMNESIRIAKKVITVVPNANSIPYRIGKWSQECQEIWKWGKETPTFSMWKYFESSDHNFKWVIKEYSVDPFHALRFMRTAGFSNIAGFEDWYHSMTSEELEQLNQGYMLITIAEKISYFETQKIIAEKISNSETQKIEINPTNSEFQVRGIIRNVPEIQITGALDKLAVINHQAVSLYYEQGWSKERLAEYYNPCGVFKEVRVYAYSDKNWNIRDNVRVIGWNTESDLYSQIANYSPDIIRCYEINQPFCNIALQIAYDLGIPSYLSLHDSRKTHTSEIAQYDVVTAFDPDLAESVSKKFGIKVETHWNGVDPEIFKPTDEMISFPAGSPRIFTVGRGDPVKNIKSMVEATALLAEEYPDLCHIIAGPNTEQFCMQAHAMSTGKTSEQNIVKYLNWCDVFFQVQEVPELSTAVIEALMVGKPVVTGGLPYNLFSQEIMEDKGNIVYPNKVHDPLWMRTVIKDLLITGHSNTIRNWAIENFDAKIWRQKEAQRYINLAASIKLAQPKIISEIVSTNETIEQSSVIVQPEIIFWKNVDPVVWNSVIPASNEAWLYHSYEWQKLMDEAWQAKVHSFAIMDGDKILVIFPLNVIQESNLLDSGFGHGGIAFVPNLSILEKEGYLKIAMDHIKNSMIMQNYPYFRIVLPGGIKNHKDMFQMYLDYGFQDISTVTYVIDLSQSEDEIFSKFSSTMRHDIRKNTEDITVIEGKGDSYLDKYYKLHCDTYNRTGVKPHPREYFEYIWNHFRPGGYNTFLFANYNGQVIAADNIAMFKNYALYSTGCSSEKGLSLNANKILQWHAIKFAKSKGCKFYESGEGFPNITDTTDKRYGLTRFKKAFGGELRPFYKAMFIL